MGQRNELRSLHQKPEPTRKYIQTRNVLRPGYYL